MLSSSIYKSGDSTEERIINADWDNCGSLIEGVIFALDVECGLIKEMREVGLGVSR